MVGNCPKCGATVSKVNLNVVEVISSRGPMLKGVSFLCQSCNCVLGVSVDPVPSTADSEVAKALADS
jgi:hypothetical protein